MTHLPPNDLPTPTAPAPGPDLDPAPYRPVWTPAMDDALAEFARLAGDLRTSLARW